jgi:hypothetical protein
MNADKNESRVVICVYRRSSAVAFPYLFSALRRNGLAAAEIVTPAAAGIARTSGGAGSAAPTSSSENLMPESAVQSAAQSTAMESP